MRQKLQTLMITLALAVGVGVAAAAPAQALKIYGACNGSTSTVCEAKSDSVNGPVRVVINTLLFVIGVISVIMIIIGGIRYTLSNGNSSQITSAKDTILYAVIGLIVALLAFAIVNFVVNQFS